MPKIPAGSWEGSMINGEHIVYLRWTRKLPSEEVIEPRTPGDEIVPQPRDGERIVFASHFLVGFGLPARSFLQHFLRSFVLQMHHLGVNLILYITCFVTMCDAYLGIRSFPTFFPPFLLLPQPEAWRGGLLLWRHGNLQVERPTDAEDEVP
ncbi:hypothetical protein D1007_29298 [Hordeum vulgare]|nr:hypothetical protein D1007_29298 [Hordeum vulgare]